MKLYQIPLGLCKEEFAKAILIGLGAAELLISRTNAGKIAIEELSENTNVEFALPEDLIQGIKDGTIRCDRSWSSPPDDYLVMLATYARGEEPAEC